MKDLGFIFAAITALAVGMAVIVGIWLFGVAVCVATYGAIAWVICEVLQSFGVI